MRKRNEVEIRLREPIAVADGGGDDDQKSDPGLRQSKVFVQDLRCAERG